MCLKIMLKVTKNQGFTLSLEDTFSRIRTEYGEILRMQAKKEQKNSECGHSLRSVPKG